MKLLLCLMLATTLPAQADTKEKMKMAFQSLVELIPFITDEAAFKDKTNEKTIATNLENLRVAFKSANHERVLKQDVFAPSYDLINEHMAESVRAFNKGNKDYVAWRMKEVTSLCLDCHTRLPVGHASSFREGKNVINESKFSNTYNLGIAQMIVRQYPEAKQSFTKVIEEKLLIPNVTDLILPFKQLMVINLKVERSPANMLAVIEHYLGKKNFPDNERKTLTSWQTDLKRWSKDKFLKNPPTNDKEMRNFIFQAVKPSFKDDSLYMGNAEVDLLVTSGILSNYLFENTKSALAPDMLYWLGLSEKYLKRDMFLSSGDLFLKLCVRKYPKSEVARRCYTEYESNVEFQFTGSRGTEIPEEVQKELKALKDQLKKTH
jgi:hypothetical protein